MLPLTWSSWTYFFRGSLDGSSHHTVLIYKRCTSVWTHFKSCPWRCITQALAARRPWPIRQPSRAKYHSLHLFDSGETQIPQLPPEWMLFDLCLAISLQWLSCPLVPEKNSADLYTQANSQRLKEMPPSFSNNDTVEPSLSLDLKFKDVLCWFSNAFADTYLHILKEGVKRLKLCWASQLSLSSMEFVNRMWKHLVPLIFILVTLPTQICC